MGVVKRILKFFAAFFSLRIVITAWCAGFGLIVGFTILLWFLIGRGPYDQPKAQKQWGITFSIPYAEQLGLDWRDAYRAMLDELGAREIRIPAYWRRIEPEHYQFDFSEIDWQIEEAKKRNARVILAIGRRLPRWPECHAPEWAKSLPEAKQREEILRMIETVVSRYREERTIWAWQVENEPFVIFFGKCPRYDTDFFAKEIARVRSIDSTRPIVASDSGELSLWLKTAQFSDVFGTTMYRIVPTLDQKGFTTWNIPAELYNKKANLLQKIFPQQDIMILELQGEAWAQTKPIQELTIEEQYASMSPGFFRDTIAYVRRTGFHRVYLWGAEWWYWLTLKGHPEIWDQAKALFDE